MSKSSKTDERVRVTHRDGVADVRLNRPEKMNALDDAMFQGIIEAGLQLKEDKSLRAVVVSGEGRAFCAGLDFSSFGAMAGEGGPTREEESADRAAAGMLAWVKHDSQRQPVHARR